jgi:predicted RNA-binding Zn-ribbon protein involved in translation (DUF1610 family)
MADSSEKTPFGCPACHCYAIYRSKLRGFEHVKKFFTAERPYRCHDCGWRGWLENIRYATVPLPENRRPPAE